MKLSPNAGISMENNTLIIERVKKDDEGLYECRVSNEMGRDSTMAFIKIEGEAANECTSLVIRA